MRSISLTALQRLEVQDVPEPAIAAPHDVLLNVGAVGVCGSDVHYYTTGRIGSQVVAFPFRVGHEFGATVAAVGPGVTRLHPGDRVAVDPAISCLACDQCAAGRFHTCRRLHFLGCPGQIEGCLCDRIVMPESCCYVVPPCFTTETAALVEPVAVGCYAVKLAERVPGARIAILGCGPIGLSVLLASRTAGALRILATDPIASRRSLAARFGADWTGAPDADPMETEPEGVDIVFECCGQQAALDQASRILKPGGKLMVVGIPACDRVSFPIDLLRRHELSIQNVRRQNECVPAAIDLLSGPAGGLAASMVTHRFDPSGADAAFRLAAGYGDGVVKAMIRFDVRPESFACRAS